MKMVVERLIGPMMGDADHCSPRGGPVIRHPWYKGWGQCRPVGVNWLRLTVASRLTPSRPPIFDDHASGFANVALDVPPSLGPKHCEFDSNRKYQRLSLDENVESVVHNGCDGVTVCEVPKSMRAQLCNAFSCVECWRLRQNWFVRHLTAVGRLYIPLMVGHAIFYKCEIRGKRGKGKLYR